jgi:hypothetical protein
MGGSKHHNSCLDVFTTRSQLWLDAETAGYTRGKLVFRAKLHHERYSCSSR